MRSACRGQALGAGTLGLVAAVVFVAGCGGSGGGRDARDATVVDASHDGDPIDATGDAGDGPGDGGMPARNLIRVTTTSVDDSDDGLCSLWEAIAAVNGQAAVNTDDCPAGVGDDVIELPEGTFVVDTTLEPTDSVEIRGAGREQTIVSFSGGALACGVRFATAGKHVWLTDLTLRAGAAGSAPPALTGVCMTAGTVRIRHARVNGFTAGGLRAEAAGAADTKLEIYNALVDGNSNAGDGGGVAFVGAPSWISIEQSSIVNNTSEGRGGGIFGNGGNNANYVINSTVSGNVARRGGGVWAHIFDQTYLGIVFSTVAFNRALEVGGGLNVEADNPSANAFLTAAIVAANTADGDPTQANLNADWSSSFSCEGSIFGVGALPRQPGSNDNSCRYDGVDPKLGPLMDMGGSDHLPMHALLPGSPAIDAAARRRPFDVLEQRDVWNGEIGDAPVGTDPGDTPAWSLFGREVVLNPLADSGAYEFNPRWEAELLAVAARSAPGHSIVTVGGAFSHGAGTRLDAGGAGDFVVYQVPVPEAGSYAISARIRSGGDAGMFQLLVGDVLAGPFVSVGAPRDGYTVGPSWQLLDLGTATLSSPGQTFFKFAVTGKDDASAGYGFVLDYLTVSKQ